MEFELHSRMRSIHLAKFAYDNDASCSWVDEPPDFLVNTPVNGVTVLYQINKARHDGIP